MPPINYSIKDLDKVAKVEGKVRNIEVTRLTAPGENYLSLVLRVDIEIEKNGHTRTVNTVAKRVPLVTNQFGSMNVQAMKNEIKWYSEMVPLISSFASRYGINYSDLYPKYYGSRYSLDPSKKDADTDSVLLVENLIPQGYQNDDRYIGCDLITSKAVLKSLAIFHAVPISMKLNSPEQFKIVKDFIDNSRPHPPGGPPGEHPPGSPGASHQGPPGPPQGPPKFKEGKLIFDAILNIPECAPYITRLKSLLDKSMGPPGFWNHNPEEPWATITHNDFWVNNVMVKHRPEQVPLVKLVDFQMCGYRSYASDLVFFLLSSVKNEVQREYLDDLIRYYYDEFRNALKQLEVDLELTYQDYLQELETTAKDHEASHAISFSTIIFGEKATGPDVALVGFDPGTMMSKMIENMSQLQKEKIVVMASEATKRNWI